MVVENQVYLLLEALPSLFRPNSRPKFRGSMSDAERAVAFGHGEPQPLAARHNAIHHVVAVMSGKGGVGKSLVTGLLASALNRAGYKVGVLDADVTGPSIPKLFGVHGPVTGGPQGINPITSTAGVKLMSLNLLLEDEGETVVLRWFLAEPRCVVGTIQDVDAVRHIITLNTPESPGESAGQPETAVIVSNPGAIHNHPHQHPRR